ncbi:Uncharacterised protein [Staphylococcus aureus]|nr:Uncharacterised protein [Staphylococcus aureus]CAC7160149.1 Uncharacterised protein [Staphylococcus aureus]
MRPGIALVLLKIAAMTHNPINVTVKAMNTREKSHGFPHSSDMSQIAGVVLAVPAINISSASFLVCGLNTSESISFKLRFKLSSLPASLPIDLVALSNKLLASFFKSVFCAVSCALASICLSIDSLCMSDVLVDCVLADDIPSSPVLGATDCVCVVSSFSVFLR